MSNLGNHTNKSGIVARCFLLLCLIVIVAAACGDSDGPSYGATASADATAARFAAFEGDEESTMAAPLLDLIGVDIADEEALDDYYAAQYLEVEALTAECMAAAGFEYKPLDIARMNEAMHNGEGYHLSREYADDYGFGISALDDPFRDVEIFPGMITSNPAIEIVNPNEAYIFALSPGESDAYFLALQGGEDSCRARADRQALPLDSVMFELGFGFEDKQAVINADPRVVEAALSWHPCMADAGYVFADRADAEQAVHEEFEAVMADLTSHVRSGGSDITPALQRELDQVFAQERAMALASWDCEIPRRDMERVVEREFEQWLATEHGGAIQAAVGA